MIEQRPPSPEEGEEKVRILHHRVAALICALAALVATSTPRVAAAAPLLLAAPGNAVVGQPVVFIANGLDPAAAYEVVFGDGTVGVLPPNVPSASIVHRYATTGTLTAALALIGLGRVAFTRVNILANQVRVPIGQVLDTFALGAPALAGGDISIIVHYRITSPLASTINNQSNLQMVVDLDDPNGRLIRRSDPFALFVSPFAQTGIQTAAIPYSVPVDAGGPYKLLVYIRTAQGGTVASGQPLLLQVLGGPDPAPKLVNTFHASGAIVLGSSIGGVGTSANIGLTTALEWPTYALTIAGLYDPISHKSDPVFTLASATPGPVSAPDASATATPAQTVTNAPPKSVTKGATPSPNPVPSPSPPPVAVNPPPAAAATNGLKYADVFGRAQAVLPAFLGGGETLHGLDFTYNYTDVIYHVGAGFTQMPTSTTGLRRGWLTDLTRAWSPNSSLRFSITDNRDDPGSFISVGGSDPLDGKTAFLEWDRAFSPHFKGIFTGARSDATDLSTNASIPDGAEKADFVYNNGNANYEFEYHNAGELFATGGGLGAQADRVGGSLTMQIGLSPITQLGAVFKHEDEHSIFSRDGLMEGSLTIAPPTGASLTLTAQTDHQLSLGSDGWTNGATWALQRAVGTSTWNVSGSLTDVHDLLMPLADGTTRTAAAQYQFHLGPSALGFGFTASNVTGSNPNTQVNGTVNYGLSFGGLAPVAQGQQPSIGAATRRFQLQSSFSATNVRQATSGGRDLVWNALLSYHLTPQIAPGINFIDQHHADENPSLNAQATALRLRLDLQI